LSFIASRQKLANHDDDICKAREGILAFMMTTKDGYVEYTGLANRFLREVGVVIVVGWCFVVQTISASF
jgi:hypothetical protein